MLWKISCRGENVSFAMTHKHSCQPSSVKQGLQLVLHQSFWQVTSPNLHALVFYLKNPGKPSDYRYGLKAEKSGWSQLLKCQWTFLDDWFYPVLLTFCVCVSSLAANKRKGLQWVIDMTIAYPKARPMDIQTWIFGYRPPTVTHVHYR